MKLFIKTFGCRTNLFDTQVIMQNLGLYEVADSEAEADIVIINSCTVTNGADSGMRNYVSSVKSKNPNAKIFVTGCAATTEGAKLFEAGKIHAVFGHSLKEQTEALVVRPERFFELGDSLHIDSTIVEEMVGRTRAFIKVQEGCDFECSYCIIPTVRGAARSVPFAQVVRQVSTLAEKGFTEFILTGTNVGSYGAEFGLSLAKLLKGLSAISGVRRLRVGSIEPSQIDDEFMELLNEPWMARHLHIALQHTDDRMLQMMQRRNRFESDLELFCKLSEKNYALGTDFIVGFPNESEDIWQKGVQNFEQMPLTHLHAFIYSKRDGTKAALLKQSVAGNIAKKRHEEISRIALQKNAEFRKRQKGELLVLLENSEDDVFVGFDQFYNKVQIKSEKDMRGEWVSLKPDEVGYADS